ncbi:hypothetical protein ACWIG5_38660 [Streptomyces lydicus]
MLQRGDIGGARREVVAKTEEHPDTSKSILGLIIDAGLDGPEHVAKLLWAMAESHPQQTTQCVAHLLHDSPAPGGEVLHRFNGALSTALRTRILTLLASSSRIPNVHGLSQGFTDLSRLLGTFRRGQLTEALTATELVTAEELAAGHLVEAVPEFGTVLGAMAAVRPGQTAALLSRALTDWSTRAFIPVAPELYRPVQNLAVAVLELDLGSSALTGEILTSHPCNGMLLFHTMQWLEHPRLPGLLAALIDEDDVVDVLARMVIGSNEDHRRLKIFEKLIIQAPAAAEPIIRRVIFRDPPSGLALVPSARKLAPPLVERIHALLAEQEADHSASEQSQPEPGTHTALPILPPWFAPDTAPAPISAPEPPRKTPPPKPEEPPARKTRSPRPTEPVKEARPQRPTRARPLPTRSTGPVDEIDFVSPTRYFRKRDEEQPPRQRITEPEPFPVGEAPPTTKPVIGG